MKISVNKEDLIEILNAHYKKSGMEIESIGIKESFSLVLKESNTDDIYEERRREFLRKYYETFGSEAPYPFKEKDPNRKEIFSVNIYGIKSNFL